MKIARVQLPDGRIGRFEVPDGTSAAEIERFASLGVDPNTGEYDESLSHLRASMLGGPRSSTGSDRPYTLTLPVVGTRFKVGGPVASAARALSNVDDETSTPIVLGTAAALAFPPSAAASGSGLMASLASRFGPSVLASGVGGGAGGALAESQQRDATPGSIAGAALRGGAMMAATEAGGLGLGALANRAIAPNLARYVDPIKPLRERIAASGVTQELRNAMSGLAQYLPTGGRAGAAVQRAGKVAASPLGGELLEAAAIPAAMALGGPTVAIPLWLARAAFAPSVLQRYLARSRLPNELARMGGRHATTTAIRYPLIPNDGLPGRRDRQANFERLGQMQRQ
jgi:hypothetical protein